jgi:hypothetical protein
LDFTSGTAVDGAYEVTVTGVNTFTVTQASRTTSGNVTVRQNTIRASGNVSSIADNGTGDYTVNFTTAMPDANYAFSICAGRYGSNVPVPVGGRTTQPTTSSMRIYTTITDGSSGFDPEQVAFSVFR